jgi:hypothetical protein
MWKIAAAALVIIGCSKDDSTPRPATSADAEPAVTAEASAPSSAPTPSATAAAPPHDCPKGSSGEGSFAKPCEAKGNARLMEVAWTGKTDDKGPHFRVTNKAAQVILYGKIAVYFYDKAGKQLDVPDDSVTPAKTVPFRTCSGNFFGGVMKAGEKAVLTFSCVAKKHVPEGTAAIEAEMQSVGFADATEKKADSYWRNNDLTPDVRKKGGVK